MANVFKLKTKSNVNSNGFDTVFQTPEDTSVVVLSMVLANKSTNHIKGTVKLLTGTEEIINNFIDYNNNGDGADQGDNVLLEDGVNGLLLESSKYEVNEPVTLLHEVSVPSNATLELFQGQKLVLKYNDRIVVKCDTADALDFSLSMLEIT